MEKITSKKRPAGGRKAGRFLLFVTVFVLVCVLLNVLCVTFSVNSKVDLFSLGELVSVIFGAGVIGYFLILKDDKPKEDDTARS